MYLYIYIYIYIYILNTLNKVSYHVFLEVLNRNKSRVHAAPDLLPLCSFVTVACHCTQIYAKIGEGKVYVR